MQLAREVILVTGGYGFLGRNVVHQLRERGCNVIACRGREYDLRNKEYADMLFHRHRPTVVIHCAAAVGGIQANQREPGRYFRDSLLMGVNVIDACREYGVQKCCVVGSVCSYPKFCPVPFLPESFFQGRPEETNEGYGASKRALLVMLESYKAQYGLDFAYPVLANLYGPYDQFDESPSPVIPALIKKFVAAVRTGAREVEVWGDGTASREFLFVRDAARAVVECAESASGFVNVGTGIETTIAELARIIAELTGFRGELKWNAARQNGQPRRQLGALWPMETTRLH